MSDLPPPPPPPPPTPPPPPPPTPSPGWHSWPPPHTAADVAYGSDAQGRGPQFAPRRAAHPTLPWQAGAGALAVLVVSLLGSKYLLDLLVGFEWPIVLYVVILGVTGYGPSVAWWLYASRRWGTGRPIADVGGTPRWADVGWGPVIWLAAIGTKIAFGIVVIALDIPLSNNTDGIDELSADRSYVVALVVTAVIAAPVVEELVFRGLVMRSLLSRIPAVPAIVVQGVLFGAAHVDPVRGVGNIGLVMILSGVGVAFGGAAYLLRRTGPTMVAHAVFNGVVMFLVLSGISDRVREENPDPFGASVVTEQAGAAEPTKVSPRP